MEPARVRPVHVPVAPPAPPGPVGERSTSLGPNSVENEGPLYHYSSSAPNAPTIHGKLTKAGLEASQSIQVDLGPRSVPENCPIGPQNGSKTAPFSASPSGSIVALQRTSSTSVSSQDASTEAFVAAHTRGWQHGVQIPQTVLKYFPYESADQATHTAFELDMFAPCLDVGEVNNALAAASRRRSSVRPLTRTDTAGFDPQAPVSLFSGYCSVPNTSLNIPNSLRQRRKASGAMSTTLPQLCYQMHHNVGELSYTFGGIYTCEETSLKMLGLPRDTAPDRISVHFDCMLPPHVLYNILTSPYLVPNTELYIFNPVRGTISVEDGVVLQEHFPGHISCLSSTQVSERHVFFYGGFSISVELVEYVNDCDRWIVRKRLRMNPHGYILDTVTLKFQKILLKPKDRLLPYPGRVGNSLISNVYQKYDHDSEYPARVPLPPVFSDNETGFAELPPFVAPPKLTFLPRAGKPEPFRLPELATVHTSISLVAGHASDLDLPSVSKTGTELSQTVSSQNTPRSPQTAPISLQNASKHSHTSSSMSQAGNIASQNATAASAAPKLRSRGSEPISTRLTPVLANLKSGVSTTEPSSMQKMTNALSKLSRLFHRSHHKTPSTPSAKPVPLHPLLNSYSSQVKQHRSNSQHSNSSRPASPIKASTVPIVAAERSFPRVSSPTYLSADSHSDLSSEYEFKVARKSPSISVNGRSPAPRGPLVLKETLLASSETSSVSDEAKYAEETQLVAEGSVSSSRNVLFTDSIVKAGILSVSVFVFGGFICEDAEPHQRFHATQEFLKIELMIQEEMQSIRFLEEAVVFSLGKDMKCPISGEAVVYPESWPSPRGYFASALINYSLGFNNNCEWFAAAQNQRSSSPFSDDVSNSDQSFETSPEKPHLRVKLEKNGSYFYNKALLVQGGCDNSSVFSDFYLFVFNTGQWQTFSTYTRDYFNTPLAPDADDDLEYYTRHNLVRDPQLVEAELRACHHTALYYQNEEHDYLFFMGGFSNDYLRNFDKEPYQSEKFDVSRLARFQVGTSNDVISRVAVLNLQTQTWLFLRYHYDILRVVSQGFALRVATELAWKNARFLNHGGLISLTGKVITLCQGLVTVVPEKKTDFARLQRELSNGALLFGGHAHFVFPSL